MSAKKWDQYTEHLALVGQWDPGTNIVNRDIAEQVRRHALPDQVALQGVRILRQVWATLPSDLRKRGLDALEDIGMDIADAAGASVESFPVIGAIVKAGIQNAVQIAEASKILKDHKKAKSNYAHGKAQQKTIYGAFDTGQSYDGARGSYHGGLYIRANVYEFAQFVKVRAGGDYDRKPCFRRPGGLRDSIFLGNSSPAGKGCKKDMRRKGAESLGPFDPKCGRTLGLSASLWPWWSAAYEPQPLPRWVVDPKATFTEPDSPDTNATLTKIQAALITDPIKNLQASFHDVEVKVSRFLSWWDRHNNRVYDMYNGILGSNVSKKIDARKDPSHKLHAGASSYWYYDEDGYIRTYEGQLTDPKFGHADFDRWGVALPDGDPKNLGVTIAQHNAVLAARAAFAQRRLATLRTPAIVEAVIMTVPGGLSALDSGARDAVLYARDASGLLPYPGGSRPTKTSVFVAPKSGMLTKKAVMGRPKIPTQQVVGGRIPPLTDPSKKKGSALPLVAGAAAVVFLMAKK